MSGWHTRLVASMMLSSMPFSYKNILLNLIAFSNTIIEINQGERGLTLQV